MIELTEFEPGSEAVTATVHMTAMPAAEAFKGPLHIGYYVGQDEVFLVSEGHRINLPNHLIAPIIKQLKRAQQIAKEQAIK